MTKLSTDNGAGEAVTTTPTPRLNLSSFEHIRLEMGRVYRDMRNCAIDAQDGSRFIYTLTSISKVMEVEIADKEKNIHDVAVVYTQADSILEGIDLENLTKEQLDALELAVNTIDGLRATPLP